MLEIFFEVLVWYGTPHLWYGIIVVGVNVCTTLKVE